MLKKTIYLSIFVLFLSLKITHAGPLYGKGELKMTENAINGFIQYIKINNKIVNGKRAKPDSFIISSNGDWYWYWWCAHTECWSNDKPTLEKCERATGVSCGRFAKRRTIFWDNGINTKGKRARFKSKMSDQEIRDKLREMGFIESNGSSTTNKPKITKKSPDISEQLSQIKKLYDDGVLTKEEYEKAKKRILN